MGGRFPASGTGEDGYFGLVPANSAEDDVKDPNFAAADGWLFTRCMFGCKGVDIIRGRFPRIPWLAYPPHTHTHTHTPRDALCSYVHIRIGC